MIINDKEYYDAERVDDFCKDERERYKKLHKEVVELREFKEAMMKKVYFDIEEHNINNEKQITADDIIKYWMEIDL